MLSCSLADKVRVEMSHPVCLRYTHHATPRLWCTPTGLLTTVFFWVFFLVCLVDTDDFSAFVNYLGFNRLLNPPWVSIMYAEPFVTQHQMVSLVCESYSTRKCRLIIILCCI